MAKARAVPGVEAATVASPRTVQEGQLIEIVARRHLRGDAAGEAPTPVICRPLRQEYAPGVSLIRTKAEPEPLLGVSVAPTMVALLACYVPARRAARVDPLVALRDE